MIYLDEDGFDRQHYKFACGRERIPGEVRCLIFDVDPLPTAGKGGSRDGSGWKTGITHRTI
jgi:hypothetical protein